MKHHLSIDLETFSNIDIKRAGLYRYVQSPNFEILLFAYSIDGAPVQVVDVAQGEAIPESILTALTNPDYLKHAYNAAFEWCCLRRYTGQELPPSQWRDTMLHGLYCGYTAGLEATGRALGIPEDKQKLNTGKALIRYFCVPCKPTKANGGRTRNYPQHDPDKWNLFKAYNAQDVEAEMEIERYLSSFPVPDAVQKQWETDLIINARGVAVDMEFVHGALEMGDKVRTELTEEAVNISGLYNPNSVRQLSQWLSDATGADVSNLRKETVNEMLGRNDNSDEVQRMLEIRQELGKTSTKKYDAIQEAVCEDDRVRGLLQFYGASRTGRWCLTGDHEVLTPTGWTRLDEWTGGKILCWASTTEYFSFKSANAVSFPYSGEMYSIDQQRCEQVCTPDHKMAVLQKDGSWAPVTMSSLGTHRFTIPFTGRRITATSKDSNALRVLIMTQADGFYTAEGDIRYHFKKSRKVERCKTLLRRADIPFLYSEHNDGSYSVVVKNRNAPIWLRQFKDKTLGWWMLDESADAIFDELQYWDASRGGPSSIQYVTTKKQNADVLQAAAILSGRSATLLTKKRLNDNWSTAYILNIWENPGHGTGIRSGQVSRCDFSGTVYCAETLTGYFLVRRRGKCWITGNSGRLVQVQNLPRTYTEPLEFARELVKGRKLNALKAVYGSVQDTLSQLIRTAFIAPQGNVLIDADFSAIEARVISWLAGEEWRLEVFRTHGKIYEASASQMFGVPLERIKKGNPEYALRQRGKVAELALGYQGSVPAMRQMDTDKLLADLPDEEIQDIVDKWRNTNPKICDLWRSFNDAAIRVIQSGGSIRVRYCVVSRECDCVRGTSCLTIALPSGRKLYYIDPAVGKNRWGRPSISYMGVDQTKKWQRIETYGGKLVENCVQAIARDCLAQAIEHLEAAGLPVVFHVHDEVVIDIAPFGTEKEMLDKVVSLMTIPIPWAPDLPLGADGWVGQFFKKD